MANSGGNLISITSAKFSPQDTLFFFLSLCQLFKNIFYTLHVTPIFVHFFKSNCNKDYKIFFLTLYQILQYVFTFNLLPN